MARKVVYYGEGSRKRELRVSEEILKELDIPEGSHVTQAEYDRISYHISEKGKQIGAFKR